MKWEYKTVCLDNHVLEENLNSLGTEGWELVCFSEAMGSIRRYILKRPKDPVRTALEPRWKPDTPCST